MQSVSTRSRIAGLSGTAVKRSQPCRFVAASAIQGSKREKTEQPGSNKVAASAAGMLAAAQLMLSGPVYAETAHLVPLQSQHSRVESVVADLSSQELENKAISKASEAGKAVLGASDSVAAKSKGSSQGIGDKVQGLANKAKNAAPDLSALPASKNVVADLSSQELQDKASGKASEAGKKVLGAADSASASAKSGSGLNLGGKAQELANKAKNAAPDLSGLSEANQGLRDGADVLTGRQGGAGESASSVGNMSTGSATDAAKGKAADAQKEALAIPGTSKADK